MVGQASSAFDKSVEAVLLDAEPDRHQHHSHRSPQTVPSKRRTSYSTRSSNSSSRNQLMNFSLRSEEDLYPSTITSSEQPYLTNSSFGIQSFESSASFRGNESPILQAGTKEQNDISCTAKQVSASPISDATTSPNVVPPVLQSTTPISQDSPPISGSSPRDFPAGAFTGPLAPFYLNSPGAGTDYGSNGTPRTGSLRSLQLSDDDANTDDGLSQAIASSSDGEESGEVEADQSTDLPQLVMPSIRMPARRPFTERGKSIGKLKIGVAGAPGVGKSSLIRSVVQHCEDIVHVDPLSDSSNPISMARKSDTPYNVIEIFASTRAYPAWWSELDDSKVLKRRKSSIGESVLERNVCFIDTPSIRGASPEHSTHAIIQYMEFLLQRNQAMAKMSNGEVLSMMSGNGGIQVDLILYILSDELRESDIEGMKRLSELTNVIPVFGKSDLMAQESTTKTTEDIIQKLNLAGIRLAHIDMHGSEHLAATLAPHIWSVSSATTRDDEVMDASLLMSSDYIQPLATSELKELVNTIFNQDTAAWLRHSSAKKFLQWRRSNAAATALTYVSTPCQHLHLHPVAQSILSSSSQSRVLVSSPNIPTTASPYTLARIRDHTHNEERQAQVHLARWAADLKRSLRNEREQFERLQRDEHRGWLIKKWEESSGEKADAQMLESQFLQPSRVPYVDYRDPLGILAWEDTIRARGILVAKVLGSCGMIGAVIVWTMRSWGWTFGWSTLPQAGASWDTFSTGCR